MSRNRKITPIDPRSSISFASGTYWLRVKMNEMTGTDYTEEGVTSAGAFSATLPILGTTTDIFDTGAGAVDSNGDNGTILATNVSDICRLDNLNGSIMCFFRYGGNTAGTNAGDGWGFNYRNPSTGTGWGIKMLTTLRAQLFASAAGAGTTATSLVGTEVSDVAGITEGFAILFHGDGAGAVSGAMYKAGTIIGELSGGVSTPAVINDDTGFGCVMSRVNDGTGNPLGSTKAGVLVTDCLVVRTAIDLRPSASRIATEHHNNKWEMIKSLNDLGV